ncbi:MAG: hypothetical protein KAX49_17405 [Halanaerobiales bacterium]|nr:hypothetical protein [Halanaerobiales bacterium]
MMYVERKEHFVDFCKCNDFISKSRLMYRILDNLSNGDSLSAPLKVFIEVASNFSKELIEGIRVFSSNSTIWMIALLSAFVSISVGANNALVVVFVEKFLGLGSQEYGLLVTFLGVGLFFGSIYIGNRKELNTISLPLALLITGISFLAFANIKNFLIALLLRLLIGIGMGIFTVISIFFTSNLYFSSKTEASI